MKKLTRKISLLTCTGVLAVCLGGVCLTGASVTANASVREDVLDTFQIQETASVRNTAPNGIRFTTMVDSTTKAKAAALEKAGYTVTYGALLCPTKFIGDELTFETLADKYECDIETKKWQDEEQTTYTSVLVGKQSSDGTYGDFLSSMYNTPISARGYMKAVKGDETQYFYTVNTAERSLAYVAFSAKAEGAQSDLLDQITANVTLDLSPMTLTTDASEGVLLYNAVAHSQQAALTIDGISATIPGVTYTVENSSIATVTENGLLTAVSVGETTLTAAYNGWSKTVTVTVTDDFLAESDYTILLASNATENEKAAANKLKEIFTATGASVSMKTETGVETTNGKYISVGATQLASQNVTLTVAKDTASEVSTVNNTVFIQGKTDKGTLYGVQQWLGEVLGYDYFMKDTYSLETKAVALPSAISYVPDIEHNAIDRNADVRAEYGLEGYAEGVIQVGGSLHNSTVILDPDTYASSHSKWYAATSKFFSSILTNSEGKAAELCYTARGNDTERAKMAQAVAEAIVAEFEANPSLHRASFCVMDGNYQCKCSSCQKAGNISDTFVPFLNDVCEKVAELLKKNGDAREDTFKIVTLAYHQTNAAPENITSLTEYSAFANHVELWFGDSYGDYTIGLDNSNSAKNKEIYTNFSNWMKLLGGADSTADTLLWVYYTNTQNGFVPYNTFDAIRANYKIAKDNGVDYILNQTIQAKSGWTMLKHYLISQLAWNADPDDATWNGWIDKYFENAYGAGATAMRQWFDKWLALDTSAYATKTNDPAIHRNMESIANFPQDTMTRWIAYANEAANALDKTDPNYTKYFNNILLEKLSPEYFLISLYKETVYVNQFTAAVDIWGITNLSETEQLKGTLEKFDALLTENSYAVTIPEESSYFNFTGSTYAVSGEDYTFTVTGKEARFDKFYVYVNDVLYEGDNGTYTVKKVSADMTIKVVHPYIEHGKNATVEYIGDTIKISNAVYTNTDYVNYLNVAYVSADYVNYMIAQGYTKLSVYIKADLVNSDIAGVKHGATAFVRNINYTTEATIRLEENYPIYFWVQKDGSGVNSLDKGAYLEVTDFKFTKADNTTESLMPTALSITAPAESCYYTFNGAGSVEKESDYTFTLTSKVDNCNDFIVLVNGEEVSAKNGIYTVKNVTEDLTVKVLHGYIEHGENVTVTYNDNGSIVIKNAAYTYCIGTNNEPWGAWISADYINYMMSQGYEKVSAYLQADFEIAAECIMYSGSANRIRTQSNYTDIAEMSLVTDAPVYFIVADAGNSGNNIRDKGGFVTITNLRFAKASVAVNAPAESCYYTFNGASSVEKEADYTFTLTNKVANCKDFIVFVNGEEISGNNGVYTVKNVTEDLTVKVLHGYIEHESNVTVTYNDDGSIKFEKIAPNSKENSIGWISADYINYMIGKGYKYIGLTITLSDPTLANTGMAQVATKELNMSLWQQNGVYTQKTKCNMLELPEVVTGDLKFWLQHDGSHGNVQEGGYMTITDLCFAKELVTVTAPATSGYYTFNGATSAAKGGTYTFTITNTVALCDQFIVFVNGEEITGNNGTYTVKNVVDTLTVKVLHGYIEHGTGASVTYNEGGSIIVEGTGTTYDTTYLSYISADFVNYMISQGYTKMRLTMTPGGSGEQIATQALVMCGGSSVVRQKGINTDEDNYDSIAELTLTADNPIIFWTQINGYGNSNNGTTMNMTITDLDFVK